MFIILFFTFFCANVLANSSTFGISLNASQFSNSPTTNQNQSIPDGYQKTGIGLFSQSSFSKNTRILTAKLETLNLTQKAYTINGYNFPQNSSGGIRSVEMLFSQYLFTSYGWKTFINFGYNTKGTQNNEQIKFALVGQEFVSGLTLMKNSKYKDPTLAPILTGLLNISEKRSYIIQINGINGLGYSAFEGIGSFVFPIHKNINFKILGKTKRYNFQKNAPLLFQNESKIMGGLILKSKNNNFVEFNVYYDEIIKEKGVSIGYFYFINHSKSNEAYQTVEKLKSKYSPQKEKGGEKPKSKEITQEEIKQTVRETLEEMGY